MQKIKEFTTQYKATIALFGSNEVEKSTLVTNLIYQLETKCEKETPGCDIQFYFSKTYETGHLDSHSLLIKFIDVGKISIETNKEQINEISNISNIVCFMTETDNEKSIQYIESLAKIATKLDSNNCILIIDITDKQKQSNTQSEIKNKLLSSLKSKETIEVCSNKRESVNAFGDLIRRKITNMINHEKERYLVYEKDFDTIPELFYVKKIKKSYACL